MNKLWEMWSAAPLRTLRVGLGLVLCYASVDALWWSGLDARYLAATTYFDYAGWAWLPRVSASWIRALHVLQLIAAVGMLWGRFIRIWLGLVFLVFTYLHSIDSTNYINHYYLLSLLLFGLWVAPTPRGGYVAAWSIIMFRVQFGFVYFFAGWAKLNKDWLAYALPLRIWLPQKATQMPEPIADMLRQPWMAYFGSWAAAFYDLTIAAWLSMARTRTLAYLAVLVFHIVTGYLFNIGLFPPLMIIGALVFFPAEAHAQAWNWWDTQCRRDKLSISESLYLIPSNTKRALIHISLGSYFLVQLLLPLRYLWYSSDVLWAEEGYRFAWRVMLVEKAAQATFYVHGYQNGILRVYTVDPEDFLTSFQAKRLCTQPDHIAQFARQLKTFYTARYGLKEVRVTADIFVSVNGRLSRRLVDADTDLSLVSYGWRPKTWVLP